LGLEIIDTAIRIKAEKKKAAEEKLAKEKRLKALYKEWTSLYNYTLVDFRKWGPDMLQEVEDIDTLGDRLSNPSKASKTLRASRKKALPVTPRIKYILPQLDFPELPILPIKPRSTILLPPPLSSPPSAPSP